MEMFAAHCSMLVVVAAVMDIVAGMVAVDTFPVAGRHEADNDKDKGCSRKNKLGYFIFKFGGVLLPPTAL